MNKYIYPTKTINEVEMINVVLLRDIHATAILLLLPCAWRHSFSALSFSTPRAEIIYTHQGQYLFIILHIFKESPCFDIHICSGI